MAGSVDDSSTELTRAADHWVGSFRAMASPCQVLMEVDDGQDARRILSIVSSEAWRVERKFSRYRTDNLVHEINRADGRLIQVDEETARLLDFAAHLWQLSGGRFDITSGVLGRLWRFDGGDRVPDAAEVGAVLQHVGWRRVEWDGKRIRLQPGMQIDFGGIGKEYAADRAAQLVAREFDASCVINFGGDLVVARPRSNGKPWRVGIEDPSSARPQASRLINLSVGGLATSGDTKRYLLREGVRYGHVLDPTTGWPIEGAPRSVTVAAGSCTQAGMLATLAMLQGEDAEAFLEAQEVRRWVGR
jgi:thiamine biosynthesis lipoprotein